MTRAIALYSPRHEALTLIAPDGESIRVPVAEAAELAQAMLDALGVPDVVRQLVEQAA